MKYMLLNDLKSIKNYKGYFIVYYVFIIINLLFFSQTGIYECLSLEFKFNQNHSIMEILMYMFEMLLIIYISLILYFNDTKNNAEILFLRMNVKKWINLKIINITIIIYLVMIFKYVFVLLYLICKNIAIDLLFITNLIKNTLYCINIMILFIGIWSCLTNKKWILIALILFLICCTCATFYTIIDLPIFLLLLSTIILVILINVIFKKIYIDIFEYSKGG